MLRPLIAMVDDVLGLALPDRHVHRIDAFPVLAKLAGLLSLYLVVPALINTVSVFVQCGLNDCHTLNDQMLQ